MPSRPRPDVLTGNIDGAHRGEAIMTAAAAANGIEGVLRQCGVTETTLAQGQKDALDRHGYLVLPDVLNDDWLARLRAAFETAIARGQRHGQHVHLAWGDAAFDVLYTHPKVLAAVYHVLRRPFRTFPPAGRDPRPQHGLQALHQDWGRTPAEPFHVVTVLWLLDDFTPGNGATRLIPGSHRMSRPVPKAVLQPERRHPDQKLVLAEAGSALLFNGHLLHGGTRNESGGRRRVLQCQFRARELVLPCEPRPDLPERLSAAARYLLGEGDRGDEGEGDGPWQ
jgi:ectoine hydroxylase-related dioxygenase (phytanoyl-CoA dioxygenase family)